jgi:hypothetical protein
MPWPPRSSFSTRFQLLDPSPIRAVQSGSSFITVTNRHFCYVLEAALFPGEATTNKIIVGPDLAGNVVYSLDGYRTPNPIFDYGFDGDFTGNPGAWNGFISTSIHTVNGAINGPALDGFVMVKKMAVRSRTGYQRRTDHLAPFPVPPFNIITAPVKIDPGKSLSAERCAGQWLECLGERRLADLRHAEEHR